MTKFADQLYTDLMREHGSTLADTRPPAAAPRQFASRHVLLATGAGGIALAATAGALVATAGGTPASVGHPAAASGTPAYKLTSSHDGAITLAVYKTSGYAQINAKLHQLGDNVVVVPVEAGCPAMSSLPKPAISGVGQMMSLGIGVGKSGDGSVSVNASGVPAGDILVVAIQTTAQGTQSAATLTSPPAPTCVSLPVQPAGSGSNTAHSAVYSRGM